MSEFRAPHTVARLIGSPPGYVGYGDGGQLTEPVRRRPYSVILLDEIEKAHPEVWNVLLQLMDDGRLTDGEGRTVDFTNAVVVMTSNLGAGQARRGIGFTPAAEAGADERMLAAAKEAFLPEFLNRIDEIVTFQSLTPAQVEQIAGLDGRARRRRGSHEERGIALEVDGALVVPARPRRLRRGVRRPAAAAPHPAHAGEGAHQGDPRRQRQGRRHRPGHGGRGRRDRPRGPRARAGRRIARPRRAPAQCGCSPPVAAGGRDSSASEVIVSSPRAASSSTCVASSIERA